MKYTDGSLRNIHGDLWQARFSYRVEKPNGQVAWKQVSRNIRAQTQKEAQQEKERIRAELERAALLEEILPPEIVNSPKLSAFMNEKVDEQLRSGLIANTTYAKYKSEVNLIPRFIVQAGSLGESMLCLASVASVTRVRMATSQASRQSTSVLSGSSP